MRLLLPLLAAGFALGIGIAAALGVGPLPFLVVVGAIAALVLVRVRHQPLSGRGLLRGLALLLLASIAAGGASLSARVSRARPPCDVSAATGREPVTVLARVAGPAEPARGGQRQPLLALGLLEGGLVDPRRVVRPLCGAVELHREAALPPLATGAVVLVRTRLRPAVARRNPGAPSAALRYLAGGVGALARADADTLAILEPAEPGALERLRGRIRAGLAAAISDPGARSIVGALVLGDENQVPQPLREIYARAGASHLLAVSGLNLTLCALGALAVIRWLLLRIPALAERHDVRRLAAPLAAGLAIFYTLLTGAAPSAQRACVMSCACFLGLLVARPADLVRPLALAALLLLAWDPLDLFRPSFQLSFAATVGIALSLERLPRSRPASILGRVWGAIRALVLTSLGATLLTAPIVAHHFQQVSLVGLGVNLVAVPLSSFALMPLGLVGSLLELLHPSLGAPLLGLAGWLAEALNAICRFAAAPRLAALELGLGWLGALCLLALVAALLTTRPRLRALALCAALLPGIPLGVLALRAALRPSLRITFLDVGQGDSSFTRLPDGFTILVDGGGNLIGGDPGASQVVPFLRGAGVRHLDLVVASHPHPDHILGLHAVIEAFSVGELWVCWHQERDPGLAALAGRAIARGVPVLPPRRLDRAGARVVPLWPAGYQGACADPGYDGNDNSIVLRLEHGRSAALLVGDIEAEAEARLAAERPAGLLRAALLKVPHHGSATSSSERLLEAVAPRLAVISCGPENAYGFPVPEVASRYRARGVTLLRTDQLGAIEVELEASGALRWRALGRPWR
jgi:competence protein ComEC